MTVITIEQAGKYDGQEVTLKGWLYNLRESGKLLFPIFRDGTGIIQGVCALKENPEAFESLKGLTQESSVIITGKIRAEKRAPGGYEIGSAKSRSSRKFQRASPFPSSSKSMASISCSISATFGFERPAKPPFSRSRRKPSAPRANSWTARATRSPTRRCSLPPPARALPRFRSQLHRRPKAYLTQSGQLYAEAIAMALGKVYTFGPTFRAEKSKTRRHLTEFWMLEPEAAYVEFEEAMASAKASLAPSSKAS